MQACVRPGLNGSRLLSAYTHAANQTTRLPVVLELEARLAVPHRGREAGGHLEAAVDLRREPHKDVVAPARAAPDKGLSNRLDICVCDCVRIKRPQT